MVKQILRSTLLFHIPAPSAAIPSQCPSPMPLEDRNTTGPSVTPVSKLPGEKKIYSYVNMVLSVVTYYQTAGLGRLMRLSFKQMSYLKTWKLLVV